MKIWPFSQTTPTQAPAPAPVTGVMGYFSMEAISSGFKTAYSRLPDVRSCGASILKSANDLYSKLPAYKDLPSFEDVKTAAQTKWNQVKTLKIEDVATSVSTGVKTGYEFAQKHPVKTAAGCSAVALVLLGICCLRSRKEPSQEQKLARRLTTG